MKALAGAARLPLTSASSTASCGSSPLVGHAQPGMPVFEIKKFEVLPFRAS